MKISTYIAALMSAVNAFPYLMGRDPTVPYVSRESQLQARQASSSEGNCGPIACTTFDEKEQFVDVRPGSTHQYIQPGPKDLRGPCPGLNAAANHGFLPHNGIPTITQTINGLGEAYGMGNDLSGFLAAYTVAMDGDILTQTYSIGGPYTGSNLLGGNPQGISYSHNKNEGDASACRGDAYTNGGDAHSLDISTFEHLLFLADYYSMDNLRTQNGYNQKLSESTNPYYFSGPVSSVVAEAAHNFICNFMSNHSADQPNGYLDKSQLKTFFGVSGPDNNLVWNKGQEQIPQNWYRRPSSNPYDAAAALIDVQITTQKDPQSFRVGGNTGQVNSFVGVDLAVLTGGTYSAANILQGNNLACFFFQAAQAGMPDALKSSLRYTSEALDLVNQFTNPILEKLGCPALAKYDQGMFDKYPGYSYNPTGPATNYKE